MTFEEIRKEYMFNKLAGKISLLADARYHDPLYFDDFVYMIDDSAVYTSRNTSHRVIKSSEFDKTPDRYVLRGIEKLGYF